MVQEENTPIIDINNLDEELRTPDSKIISSYETLTTSGVQCTQDRSCSDNEDTDEEAPKDGLLFESYEAVYEFYRHYAIKKGFGIMKTRTELGDSGLAKSFSLACCKSGNPRHTAPNTFRKKASTKTNCMARIKARLNDDKLYFLSVVILEHNHELDLSKSHMFRSNKKLDTPTKKRLELNDRAGIRLSKTFNSFLFENGGHENMTFGEKDCRNYMDKLRHKLFGEGDAEALQSYFKRMQQKNSTFFSTIDLDETNRVKNVFWADARCRLAYESFHDVVIFDSTYLTNKYDMPFASFVGVNHHNQSILLGCGLLSDESTSTYIWLFRAFLECMFNVQPKAIITYQCGAMKNAISQIFPDTRHRLCVWHIMKKVPEKLGRHSSYHQISQVLHHLVYDSMRVTEFEEDWGKMVETFGLHSNEWLKGLFKDRNHWVPIYVKDKFWEGMSSIQRSESMNSFFDDYVHSKTTLKQFVDQYDAAMQKKVKKEIDEDFRSIDARLPLITDLAMEAQAENVYTNAIFKEFQHELKALIYCSSTALLEQIGSVCKFQVKDISKKTGQAVVLRNYLVYDVTLDITKMEVHCICQKFEFRGILCRHAICVLIDQSIDTLPPQYILSRWRKDIRRPHTDVRIFYDEFESTEEILRYEKLHARFMVIARIGAKSLSQYNNVLKCVDDIEEKLQSNEGLSTHDKQMNDVGSKNKILSPLRVSRKGRPRSKRKQSEVEKKVTSKKKKVHKAKLNEEEFNFNIPGGKRRKASVAKQDNLNQECSVLGSTLNGGADGKYRETTSPYYPSMSIVNNETHESETLGSKQFDNQNYDRSQSMMSPHHEQTPENASVSCNFYCVGFSYNGIGMALYATNSDNDLFHVLFGCSFARQILALIGIPHNIIAATGESIESWVRHCHSKLDEMEYGLFLSSLWYLWFNRNQRVMENKEIDAQVLTSMICSFHSAFVDSNIREPTPISNPMSPKWLPPDPGVIKSIFDGATFSGPDGTGLGIIVRNSSGECIYWEQRFSKKKED